MLIDEMHILVELLIWICYFVGLYFAIFWLITLADSGQYFSFQENLLKKKLLRHPRVTIAVPVYNGCKTVIETIKSVLSLRYPKELLEIIVVNDGSTDNTLGILKDFVSRTPVKILSQRRKGKGAALNKAFNASSGEYFVCLDADSIVHPSALRNALLTFQEESDNLAIVIPAMKVLKPGNILQNMQRLEYLTAVLINRIISRLSSVYVAPGPFSVYKAAVLRELGGFSENDLTEDQEIAYRTQLHQYGIVQCPLTEVYTRAPSNLIELFRQRSRWYRGSIVNLFRYRKMMLNRKYGHFGLFQMPLNFISFLLSALTILFASYFIIWPIVKAAYHLYIVGFDIKPYLLNLSLSIDLLGFDAGRTFLAATMLIIAFIILLKALSNSGEKIRAPNIPQFFIYFLFYYLILGFFCLVAVGDLIIRRNLKW